MSIPKIIHQIWIGNRQRPEALMDSCRVMNPTWEYRLWTEENLPTDFVNQEKIDSMAKNQPHYPEAGMSDIIRYELLYRYGGFYIDADTQFINPLDDYLTKNDSFCCFENEDTRGILLANGYIAATRGNALMGLLIEQLRQKESVTRDLPWIETGPLFFTQTVVNHEYDRLTVYPSHFFIPQHFSGTKMYQGPDRTYCIHHWGSTVNMYAPAGTGSLPSEGEV
jgi:inositol phosphorylceramide mannosyltransferase catalytic subunit